MNFASFNSFVVFFRMLNVLLSIVRTNMVCPCKWYVSKKLNTLNYTPANHNDTYSVCANLSATAWPRTKITSSTPAQKLIKVSPDCQQDNIVMLETVQYDHILRVIKQASCIHFKVTTPLAIFAILIDNL